VERRRPNGLDPNDAADRNGDADADGSRNLEAQGELARSIARTPSRHIRIVCRAVPELA